MNIRDPWTCPVCGARWVSSEPTSSGRVLTCSADISHHWPQTETWAEYDLRMPHPDEVGATDAGRAG